MLRRISLAALLIAAATTAFAQEREPARPGQPAGAAAGQNTQQMMDMAAANCLILGNQAEIALARWALDRTDSEEVRELANKLIEDHQAFVMKLKKYGSKDQSFEIKAKSSASGESRIRTVAGTREEGGNVTRAGGAGTMYDRFFAIEHRAAEECLSLTQECLGKYKGKEFDQAFLGQQVGGHIHMQAKLRAFEGEVSPEFQKLIKDGQKTTVEHKEHAEKLMDKLASRK